MDVQLLKLVERFSRERLMGIAMVNVNVTRDDFLQNRQGKTFADVVNDSGQPFDEVLAFFANADRQRRMEESELHHDRSPLAGVVRELEAQPGHRFIFWQKFTFGAAHACARPSVSLVRIIMELRGWKKTGRKGSLGVRAAGPEKTPAHNSGGLAFWFVRAERYQRSEGMPFRSVRERCRKLDATEP